jgi:hypothetical protein
VLDTQFNQMALRRMKICYQRKMGESTGLN